MADEKILKDESLNDEELEGVAGGTMQETVGDRSQLIKFGMYNYDKNKGFIGSIQDGFNEIGKKLGVTINVESNPSINNKKENVYRIDNQKMNRNEFWTIINEGLSTKK